MPSVATAPLTGPPSLTLNPSPRPGTLGGPATFRPSAGVPPGGRPIPRTPIGPLRPLPRTTPPRTTTARTDVPGRPTAEARTVAPLGPKGRDRPGMGASAGEGR